MKKRKILTIEKLLAGKLWQFGLNPDEWFVKCLRPSKFAVQYRQDKQIYFLGKARKKADDANWVQLRVAL